MWISKEQSEATTWGFDVTNMVSQWFLKCLLKRQHSWIWSNEHLVWCPGIYVYTIYIRIYIIIYVYIWSFCAALSSHGWLMGWFITNIWDTNFQAFLVRWGAHGPIPWYPTTHLTCQKMLRTVVLVLGALKYHVRSHHPQDTYYNLVQHDITWYHLVFFSNFWKSMYQ